MTEKIGKPSPTEGQASSAASRGWLDLVLPLLGPLLLLASWFLASSLGLVAPLLLPAPQVVLKTLASLLRSGSLFRDIGASLWRWGMGYATGCLVGVPLGLLVGSSLRLYRSPLPLLDFFRSLPVTALFPLFLLLFGIGEEAKIAMAFASTVFVVALNSAYGVLQAQRARIKAARVFGASRWQIFRWVIFFEALPQTLVGMRTTLSLSLIVVIVSEMFIGTKWGLGQRIYDAYTVNLTEELYAVLLVTGLLGYLSNRLFMAIETRLVFWTGK